MPNNLKSNILNTLNERGFIQDCTDFEGLDRYFQIGEKGNKPRAVYIGFDCTAAALHAGSLTQIMVLRWLQKLGHKPIVLLGGGTTKIGDPSGKDESRKLLDDAAIERNKAGIKKVFERYLKFGTGPTDAIVVDNAEWLDSLKYIEFLRDYGRHFSINRMLTMESVKRRLEREQNLTFLEFNYMILQAYDFVELAKNYNCRVQIGGSDQWGNIVNGTELSRRIHADNIGKSFAKAKGGAIEEEMKGATFELGGVLGTLVDNLFGLTTPLLTTSSGAKMGKTADGAVWLDAELLSPYDYWQYFRNTSDADVSKFLKLFTELDIKEIERLSALKDAAINEAKIVLANEATKMLHGEEASRKAEQTAKEVFEKGGIGDDLPVIEVENNDLNAGLPIANLFKDAGLTTSNSEARKLIQGGGARLNDEKISDVMLIVNSSHLKDGAIKLSAGKKKHAIVKVK